MQLNARLGYLKERLIRIKTDLGTYSKSSHTSVASNWAYEDDSIMTNNLNNYIHEHLTSQRMHLPGQAQGHGQIQLYQSPTPQGQASP
jgi:hypothetical protein